MKPSNGTQSIVNQMALGMFEGVMTLFGLIIIVFPLAIWAVPQQGVLANTIFYIVLSIGCGSVVALVTLSFLKGRLFPERTPQGAPVGGKARLEAYVSWSQAQDEARKAGAHLRTMKGGALYNFTFMVRVASLLGTVYVLLNLAMWAFMDFYHGSTDFLSAEERWQLAHPDHWGWK